MSVLRQCAALLLLSFHVCAPVNAEKTFAGPAEWSKRSSSTGPTIPGNSAPPCPSTSPPVTQYLVDAPYSNYFLSTCHTAGHVVVTTPQPDSNLTIIGPRLIAAFPGGNSGIAVYWAPQNGVNGSLAIDIVETNGKNLSEVYIPAKKASGKTGLPAVGLSAVMSFNSSAVLTVPILGGVRTIRDFTEGPSILQPEIQDAINFKQNSDGSVTLQRTWLDNVTSTTVGFAPMNKNGGLTLSGKNVTFKKGNYLFWTAYDYPQLKQFGESKILNPASQGLIKQQPDLTTSLSFLSYTNKLLAGTWRFLTYFGRDSMIAALLLEPVLSQGENSALEAVIGAVLERINRSDGSVCHEETLGDYATFLNEQEGIYNSHPSYSYPMIDTDYYLPILMDRYFLQTNNGSGRSGAIFSHNAGSINPANKNLTWGDLALLNAEKIMGIAGQYAAKGNQTQENLAHLKSDQIVGEWRDSTYGIGGGRIPYDVNTGLMPAALHSISALAKAGIYKNHPSWATLAATYAQVWEDTSLDFFKITVPAATAKQRLATYKKRSSFAGPDQSSQIDSDVVFHALSLDGNNNQTQVAVMNTDDCFRLFLVNGTNQTLLTQFINSTASNVRRTFPAGLMTSVGLLVANPAYGVSPVYAANWTTSAYHGTVVWSWQQAMMAKGFENHLLRCKASSPPAFCKDKGVYNNVLNAYNTLWDTIDANNAHLSEEVWSWTYNKGFNFIELGDLPPPPGSGPTESDIRQLWSLTFLAVTRNAALK